MPLRRFDLPWDSQPQGSSQVDWNNPISRSLVFSWNGADANRNAVEGSFVALSGAAPLVPCAQGLALNCIAANSVGASLGDPAWADFGASDFTFQCLYRITTPPGSGQKILFGKDSSTGRQLWVELSTTGGSIHLSIVWSLNGAGSSFTQQDLPTGVGCSANVDYNLVLARVGNSVRAWVNGAPQSAVNGAVHNGWYDVAATSTPAYIGRREYSGFPDYFDGQITLQRWWRRAIPDSEAAVLSSNPWQLFEPQVGFFRVAGSPYPTLSNLLLSSGKLRLDVTFP